MPDPTEGPYLSLAVLCEKTIEAKDGTLSLIRLIDRITVSPGPGAPENMPQTQIQIVAVIGFKSGGLRGSYNMRMTIEAPSGQETELLTMPILFEGEDRGGNLIFNLVFQAEEHGLYWFGVFIESQMVTRIPLRILYQRIGFGSLVNQGPA